MVELIGNDSLPAAVDVKVPHRLFARLVEPCERLQRQTARRLRLECEAHVAFHRLTLAEIMADSGHYSIDSTTVRAQVSAAGGKGRLIDAPLAARGAGSPVSFTVWQMSEDDPSPST